MRVLIADDDAISRRLLANMLAGWGYEVITTADGAEAWDLLQQPNAPCLAILDWMMPGLTGPAVCRELRQMRKEPYTYVLLLTARTNKEDVIEGMDAGVDDYITKPFDSQELRVRLRAGRRILDLQADLVAAREALREQATRDPLTCVWNRYAIFDTLNRELNRSARESSALSLIMADLDHFKQVNDHHGHLAGDAVLREAARRMQSCLRPYDYVGRYGGEEFLVVLPGTSKSQAVESAERLRRALAALPFAVWNLAIHITASFGVSGVEPGEDATPEALIRVGDEALYRAKESGRNRVEQGLAEAKAISDLSNLIAAVSLPGSD
jgi:two-component system, cell cycle response regulator